MHLPFGFQHEGALWWTVSQFCILPFGLEAG